MIRTRFAAHHVLALTAALVVLAGTAVTRGAEWPQWHGPQRDNLSRDTGLQKAWPEGGPPLLWTADGLGLGFSSVSVAGGVIYTAGTISNRTCVFAFDLAGKRKWRALNGESWGVPDDVAWAKTRNFEGARATPTVDDGLVYHLDELGRLAAFRAADGDEVWAVDLASTFGGEPPKWGYAESVLIDGDRVLCYPGGPKGYAVALDKKTGKTVWANTEIGDGASYCSPALVEDRGVRQVITMSAQSVLGIDADSGKLLWRYPFVNKNKINVLTPIYRDGHVFISAGYGKGSELLMLDYGEDAISVSKVWAHAGLANNHGGVLLADGFLYGAAARKGDWYCLEFSTGREMSSGKGVGDGTLTWADGMLYCLGEKGTLALVGANPEAHREVSRFQVPSGGKGLYWAHPVVCGGRLYVRHADKLYAYDVSVK